MMHLTDPTVNFLAFNGRKPWDKGLIHRRSRKARSADANKATLGFGTCYYHSAAFIVYFPV